MAKKNSRMAPGELQLLEMLWRDGPVSLSEAHAALGLPIGYTTVQTRLNRLVEKGVVKKSKTRPAQYEAGMSRETIVESDLDLLLKRVSNGNVVPLVAHLVQDRQLSSPEIQAIRNLIDNAEASLEDTRKSIEPSAKKHKRKPTKKKQAKSHNKRETQQ